MLRFVSICPDGDDFTAQFPVSFEHLRMRVGESESVFPSGGIQFDPFAFFDYGL